MAIFASLRDLHTIYTTPLPYAISHAWLPFKIEACVDGGRRRYLVSRVVDSFVHPTFRPGVEVLSWNGIPVERAAELAGVLGPNPAARQALGLARLTYRSLFWEPPPQEDSVVIHYRDGRQELELTIAWQISSMASRCGAPADNDAVCTPIQQVQQFRKFLYAPFSDCEDDWFGKPDRIPASDGEYGYIRIFTFERRGSDDDFVNRFKSIVDGFVGNTKGLVIDVRDNGGGSTRGSERIVQFVKQKEVPIVPSRLYFRATQASLALCQLGATVPDVASLGCGGTDRWVQSIKEAMSRNETFSEAFHYTCPDAANKIGRIYPSPVLVVTNALSYSAAEFFAGCFQDHGGIILGVDDTTGGGGAGVREHSRLLEYFSAGKKEKETSLRPIPKNAGFTVAYRRRAPLGAGVGQEIEDMGVRSNRMYAMTRNDVLFSNQDLKREAARLLAQMPSP